MTIDEVLAATPLFGVAEPRTIGDLARSSRWRTVQRNEVLFAVAERATSIYVIVSGTFRVFTSSMQGTEPTLALIHEGEIVASSAFSMTCPARLRLLRCVGRRS